MLPCRWRADQYDYEFQEGRTEDEVINSLITPIDEGLVLTALGPNWCECFHLIETAHRMDGRQLRDLGRENSQRVVDGQAHPYFSDAERRAQRTIDQLHQFGDRPIQPFLRQRRPYFWLLRHSIPSGTYLMAVVDLTLDALHHRSVIGHGDWNQRHYDSATRIWRENIGRIHPRDVDLGSLGDTGRFLE